MGTSRIKPRKSVNSGNTLDSLSNSGTPCSNRVRVPQLSRIAAVDLTSMCPWPSRASSIRSTYDVKEHEADSPPRKKHCHSIDEQSHALKAMPSTCHSPPAQAPERRFSNRLATKSRPNDLSNRSNHACNIPSVSEPATAAKLHGGALMAYSILGEVSTKARQFLSASESLTYSSSWATFPSRMRHRRLSSKIPGVSPDALATVHDKAFCASWVTNDVIAAGTKCGNVLRITRSKHSVEVRANVVFRKGADISWLQQLYAT